MGSIREQASSNGTVSYNLEERNASIAIQVPTKGSTIEVQSNGDTLQDKDAGSDKYRVLEIVVLCTVMVTTGILLTLPTIFYYLPVDFAVNESSNNTRTGNGEPSLSNGSCSSAFPYPAPGGVCQTELEGILFAMNCVSEDIPLVLRDEESTFGQILFGLEFLDPSPECREAVVPFLCQFQFGLCDSSGVSLHPTSGRCEDLRDRVCRTEWSAALAFGIDLPDCDSLPSVPASCQQDFSGSGSGLAQDSFTEARPDLFPCREDFFREEGSNLCLPSCYTWYEYSDTEVIVTDVLIGISSAAGFVAGLIVIVISIIRYKRMFSFPSVYIVLMTFDLVGIGFFNIVTFLDRSSLYCSSRNLLDTITAVTPFCVITGMIFSYGLLQITLWWIFHTTSLFWSIFFPFHARSFKKSVMFNLIFAASIAVGFVVPLIPIIASMADFGLEADSTEEFASGGLGYVSFRFPPLLCTATNGDVVFYTLSLPLNIIVIVGVMQLILIFWRIHKRHGLFKPKENKFPITIGTAERKILIALCYYVVLTVLALTALTLGTRNGGAFADALFSHFACESNGQDPEDPLRCDRNDFRQFSNPETTAAVSILLSLFPVVNLVYVLNIRELKNMCKKCRVAKMFHSTTSNTASTNANL